MVGVGAMLRAGGVLHAGFVGSIVLVLVGFAHLLLRLVHQVIKFVVRVSTFGFANFQSKLHTGFFRV